MNYWLKGVIFAQADIKKKLDSHWILMKQKFMLWAFHIFSCWGKTFSSAAYHTNTILLYRWTQAECLCTELDAQSSFHCATLNKRYQNKVGGLPTIARGCYLFTFWCGMVCPAWTWRNLQLWTVKWLNVHHISCPTAAFNNMQCSKITVVLLQIQQTYGKMWGCQLVFCSY